VGIISDKSKMNNNEALGSPMDPGLWLSHGSHDFIHVFMEIAFSTCSLVEHVHVFSIVTSALSFQVVLFKAMSEVCN
jgi:hypothetical protein